MEASHTDKLFEVYLNKAILMNQAPSYVAKIVLKDEFRTVQRDLTGANEITVNSVKRAQSDMSALEKPCHDDLAKYVAHYTKRS